MNLTFAEATVVALRAALEENPEVFSSPISHHLVHLVLSRHCRPPPLLAFSFSFSSPLNLFLIFLLLRMFSKLLIISLIIVKYNQDVPLIWIHDYHLMEVYFELNYDDENDDDNHDSERDIEKIKDHFRFQTL